MDTNDKPWPVRLEAYGRMEAALLTGISNVDTGPTGLCMIDMRVFEHLSLPYFDYEWDGENKQCPHCHQAIPGKRSKKASTEDCFFFRNVALNCAIRLGYNPVFCNWDAWAGHHKPKCVGKPNTIPSDAVGRQLHEATKAPQSGVRIRKSSSPMPTRLLQVNTNGKPESNGEGVIPSAPTNAQLHAMVNGIGSPMSLEDDDEPGPDDLGHKTPGDDLKALEKIIEEYVRARDWDHKLCIVELGSWVGKSARTIVGAIPHGIEYEIHCVDTWSLPEKGSQWATKPMGDAVQKRRSEGDEDPVFNQFRKNVGHLLNTRIKYHRRSTFAVANYWSQYVDILFVDADHSEKSVHNDLSSWALHIRDGGLIVCHDYRTMPEVQRAVDGFFHPRKVQPICNMCFIVKESEDGDQNECGQNSEAAISG